MRQFSRFVALMLRAAVVASLLLVLLLSLLLMLLLTLALFRCRRLSRCSAQSATTLVRLVYIWVVCYCV